MSQTNPMLPCVPSRFETGSPPETHRTKALDLGRAYGTFATTSFVLRAHCGATLPVDSLEVESQGVMPQVVYDSWQPVQEITCPTCKVSR